VARRMAVVSCFALVAFGLSACGSASANRAPNSSTTSATKVYHLTMSANSADFQYRFAVTPSNTGAGMNSTESGTYSWASDQGTVTTQGAEPGVYAITTQEIVDRNHRYTKVIRKSGPDSNYFGLGFNQGNGWTDSTVSGSTRTNLLNLFVEGTLNSLGGSGLAEPDVINPADLLGILRSESGTATNLGNEMVDGVSTTHYRTLIPLTNLVAGEGAQPLASALFGTGKLELDYWIDSGDRLRMLHAVTSIPKLPRRFESPPPTPVTTTPTTSPGEFKAIATAPASMAISPPYKYPLTFSVSLQLSNYGTDAQPSVPTRSEITSHQSCTISPSGYSCQGP
jgi:hypothetical protein